MARGKQLPFVGEDYSAAPEPPSPLEVSHAKNVVAAMDRDPDPVAFFERLLRSDPKLYLEEYRRARETLAQAAKAGAATHTRAAPTAISPIRPGIIDVPSGS
jgi:hypothetical protein